MTRSFVSSVHEYAELARSLRRSSQGIKLRGKKLEILLLNSQWTGDQHLIVRSREKMRFLENDLLTFLWWKSFKNSIQAFQNILVDIRAKLWPRQCDEVQFREGFTKRNCGVAVLENYPKEYLLPTVKRNILYFHASLPTSYTCTLSQKTKAKTRCEPAVRFALLH